MQKKWYWLVCIALPLAVGGLAGWLISDSFSLYQQLAKPPGSPPGWIFPLVWSILYLAMGLACGLVLASGAPSPQVFRAIRLYALQLWVNFLWPLLFFDMELYLIAFFWILLLFLLVALITVRFYKIVPLAGYLLIPYCVWLLFAGYLNLGIYLLN